MINWWLTQAHEFSTMTTLRWSLLTLLVLVAANRGVSAPGSPASITGLFYRPDGQFLVE